MFADSYVWGKKIVERFLMHKLQMNKSVFCHKLSARGRKPWISAATLIEGCDLATRPAEFDRNVLLIVSFYGFLIIYKHSTNDCLSICIVTKPN